MKLRPELIRAFDRAKADDATASERQRAIDLLPSHPWMRHVSEIRYQPRSHQNGITHANGTVTTVTTIRADCAEYLFIPFTRSMIYAFPELYDNSENPYDFIVVRNHELRHAHDFAFPWRMYTRPAILERTGEPGATIDRIKDTILHAKSEIRGYREELKVPNISAYARDNAEQRIGEHIIVQIYNEERLREIGK